MRYLYENMSVIFIAIVTALMAWLYGGMQHGPLVHTVPWLMLFVAEMLFFFPQRHSTETTADARERVWKALKKDPLTWVTVGFLALLAIPFANNGLCPQCDKALIAQGLIAAPPVKHLPFCVNRVNHLNVYLWFVVALSCMLATKHCLVKKGKQRLLELIVWNGMALAIFGFVELAVGAPGPWWRDSGIGWKVSYFSTWGYANAAGDYFTTLFGISVGLWRWRYDEVGAEHASTRGSHGVLPRDLFWKQNVYLIPAVVFFYATANTMSRASIMLVSALAVVFFAHTFLSFTARIGKVARVKATAISALVLGLVAYCAVTFMPEGARKEMATVGSTEVLDRVTGKSANYVSVATEIWKEHFLFGCGGWGYMHLCVPKLQEKKVVGDLGGANVHNDYMQFLAEHGAVGFGFLVAIVVMMLRPIVRTWKLLLKAARFSTSSKHMPRPLQVFVLPAPVFCFLFALIATLVHAFGDCILRSASVLTLFFVLLASLDGFMPKIADEEKEAEAKSDGPIHSDHHHHHHHASR